MTLSLPQEARFLERFEPVFGRPTYQRILVLCIGAIVASGRRTVSRVLWAVRSLADGHPGSYHRVFSRSPWSMKWAGRVLAALVLEWVPADQRVVLVVDDTTEQHRGRHVYGKGCHRDAVRSCNSHTVHLFGLKWVVLAVNVKFCFAARPWALPVLVALYRPAELDQQEGKRHKTPIQLARGLVCLMLRWFPDRRFVLLGDGGYASHELACFCRRRCRRFAHPKRLALVSRFGPKAVLHQPPPPRRQGQKGRPARKGPKLPTPKDSAAAAPRTPATVAWYGQGQRDIEFVSDSGLWYTHRGGKLIAVRWVFVHDPKDPNHDEYFYSTDTDMPPAQIIGLYTARWPIEVTFQELKQRLGLGSTRQYTRRSVLRAAPCLMALFSVVCLIFAAHARTHPWARVPRPTTYDKEQVSFSDALACVRRLLWANIILEHAAGTRSVRKLPPKLADTLLAYLADVA
jgi:hypothetical protein